MLSKKMLISSAAVVISSAIGIPAAVTVIGSQNAVQPAKYSANIVSDTFSNEINDVLSKAYEEPNSSTASIAVSSNSSAVSTPNNTPSSTQPSSTPSTPPSSTAPASSTAPSSTTPSSTLSAPDNTTARNAAITAENNRHNDALTVINNQYDPQINALQTEIAALKAEGAKDETQDIKNAQDYYDKASKGWENAKRIYGADPTAQFEIDNAWNNMNWGGTQLTNLQKLQTDYLKMTDDQSQLNNLTIQKNSNVVGENSTHTGNMSTIVAQYP